MKRYMTYLKYAFDDLGAHFTFASLSAVAALICWVFSVSGFAAGTPEIAAFVAVLLAPVFIGHAAMFFDVA